MDNIDLNKIEKIASITTICKNCREELSQKIKLLDCCGETAIVVEVGPCTACQGNLEEEIRVEQKLRKSIAEGINHEVEMLLEATRETEESILGIVVGVRGRLIQLAARAEINRIHYRVK